ncbi:MAG: SH3 domain-containing protein [Myxococcales bacterium]
MRPRSLKRPLLLALALVAMLGPAEKARADQAMTVKNLGVNLMAKPGLLAARVGAPLERGEVVTCLKKDADWYQVKTRDGREGWLKKTALVEEKVVLSKKVGGEGAAISKDEIETAGRGFTKDVEAQYRGSRGQLDKGFAALDALEKHRVDPGKAVQFAAEGKLAGGAP